MVDFVVHWLERHEFGYFEVMDLNSEVDGFIYLVNFLGRGLRSVLMWSSGLRSR